MSISIHNKEEEFYYSGKWREQKEDENEEKEAQHFSKRADEDVQHVFENGRL